MTLVSAILLATPLALAPQSASAGFFDFLFGGDQSTQTRPAQQPDAFTDPMANPAPSGPVISSAGGRFASYCVRTCDGKFFPLSARSGVTPAQMCQSFCPASATKIYSGNGIDNAVGANGERYADLPNAFAYRKALRADCTCNGRDPAGLAPVDLSLDTTLRPGDVVATANGLVAYSGVRVGNAQTAEFTPVANYPGLTADVRARLGEMKVTPVSADIADDSGADTTGSLPLSYAPAGNVPSAAPAIDAAGTKRADAMASSPSTQTRPNRPPR
ncbi:MAG TPA: DUF2865 domain-containing protein [Afipia sp.]